MTTSWASSRRPDRPARFRVLSSAEFQSNRFAGFGIASVGGYHAAKPRLFEDLLDRNALYDPHWWALLNVRYLITPQPLPPEQTPAYLRPVFSGSQHVYEFLPALPRATIVGQYEVVPDTSHAEIDSITVGAHDPSRFAYLTRDPGVPLGPTDGAAATIRRYPCTRWWST